MNNLTPKVLEIDIVLAGVDPGDTVLTVPNPEGREVITTDPMVMRLTTFDMTDPAGWVNVIVGSEALSIQVKGENLEGQTLFAQNGRLVWGAAQSLSVTLDSEGAAAPTFVGKLYVEYWGSDRVLGTSYSKQHASVYRGIRRAL